MVLIEQWRKPKSWGRGGMVDAADLNKLSLGGEISQVNALKFRET